MKSPSLLLALCLAAAPLIAAAQALPPAQADALRRDVKAASDAVARVARDADTPALRAEAADARDALGRVSAKLDALLGAQADADPYDHGNRYPALAGVSLQSFAVPLGATVVHVPVTLDQPSPNTVIAYVRVCNGRGGHAEPDTTKAVIFRPGDPLVKTVDFNVSGMDAGNDVQAVQSSVPDGGRRDGGGIRITAQKDAVNAPIPDTGRAPLAFAPLGAPCYSATGQDIKFDDRGGPDTFSTALSHGRTQVGNGETGYYGPVDMGGFARTPAGLVLSSRRLDRPVPVGSPSTLYPFLAVMLSGHRTTRAQFKYGSVEWVVKMPNRKGSWPALWLLPASGWPPEIDVYEGFGYNGSWRFPASLSTNLHGGRNGIHRFSRPAGNMKMSTFGLADTLDDAFHAFAVTVDKEWITMYVDGVETMRYANPFQGETWYPLTNVAVKAAADSPYADGSGDLVLRSLKVWRAE